MSKLVDILSYLARPRFIVLFLLLYLPFIAANNGFWTPWFETHTGKQPLDLALGLSGEQVYDYLTAYGEAGRQQYLRFQLFDFFLPIFGALFMFAVALNLLRWWRPQQPQLLKYGFLVFLPALADWSENAGFLTQLFSYPEPSPLAGQLTLLATKTKLTLLAAINGLLLVVTLLLFARSIKNQSAEFSRMNPPDLHKPLIKSGALAALLFMLVMLIHNLNALYLEPTFLGFEDPTKDYSNMQKIKNAQGSFSFTSSGYGHMVAGLSLLVLGLALAELFKRHAPARSRLILSTGFVAGIGFFLTGITDIPAAKFNNILIAQNPDYETQLFLAMALMRGLFLMSGIVALGLFAGLICWCILGSALLPKWLGYYGLLLLLPTIATPLFPPIGFSYIQIAPIFMLGLAIYLNRLAKP